MSLAKHEDSNSKFKGGSERWHSCNMETCDTTLKDVKMGEKKVGNKLFYTMDYTTVTNDVEQKASLYLYFPKKKNIGTFFVSLYSEGSLSNKPLSRSFKNEFLK